jgi:hypothetical protein
MGNGDLVDCFGNGFEDISLDVVAVEVWVQ